MTSAAAVFATKTPGHEVRRFRVGAIEAYAVFVNGKQAGQTQCVSEDSRNAQACDEAASELAERYGQWPKGIKHIEMWTRCRGR
jgi:hypothetical protein